MYTLLFVDWGKERKTKEICICCNFKRTVEKVERS